MKGLPGTTGLPPASGTAAAAIVPGTVLRRPGAGQRGTRCRAPSAHDGRSTVSLMTRHHTEAMSLHLTQIRRSFGGDDVLLDVSAIVRPRDRVALVGRNGAGKTTLLRIIAGELDAEGG